MGENAIRFFMEAFVYLFSEAINEKFKDSILVDSHTLNS